jgi:hypothetical protein
MKKRISFIVFTISVILLWGCYPQGPDYIEELDVVLTNHKDDYDFSSKSTYAMPDSIVRITGNMLEDEEPEFIPDETAQSILARIASNMDALGYTRVDLGDDPDLLMVVASWEVTTVYYYYDYWYWWYGGYYPGWGWGGYYPPVYVDSYSTGTLFMSLIDKEIVGGNGNPISQWSGACNGILTGYYDANRVGNLINKAFDQSPYLKTN